MSNSFDFEDFKAQAIEKLKVGVPLSGKDGVLAPLLENLLNSALEGEMDSHLDGVERELGNRRNGHMSKQVQTSTREDPCGLTCGQNHRPVRHRQQHKGDKRHP